MDKTQRPWTNTIQTDSSDVFDLSQIIQSGELIIATMSGPDTYYDYHHRGMGTQYLLCDRFAKLIGVSIRVDICRDTTEMTKKLNDGDVDLILTADSSGWLIAPGKEKLKEAIRQWYRPAMLAEVKKEEDLILSQKSMRRHVYAPMLDRKNGVISRYDNLFIIHSKAIGWDWRLMAAQCYQESAFDPHATSWVGACGLMQIMPSTADELSLPASDIFIPEKNIATAAKLLSQLENKFLDIRNRYERENFVLASYNGGYNHIRDAMALAEKDGEGTQEWDDVAKYVLRLSDARYYNDSVVKYGYMRGSETYNYVIGIRQRWQQYKGVRTPHVTGQQYMTPQRATHNKYKNK